jgi:tRNA-dihydrouridine synthase A
MSEPQSPAGRWRLSVAPMIDWTDRHCRYFHRLLSRHARLYTEMITTGALLHGDVGRHLRFNTEEHPVALQLGGSEPADLAACARLGEQWGYDEINLNCGCPSERVQRGAFGACLMAEPQLVADGVKAMRDVVSIPVTV